MIALTLVMQSISVGILIYSFALFVVPWIDEFGASRRDVMLAVMCSQLATGALSPFAGRAMDRFALRHLVTIGAASLVVGLALTSFARSITAIVIIFSTLMPIGIVLCGTLASQTLITRTFERKRGMAMGLSAMGTSLGGFLFPPVVEWLIASLGWRGAMQVMAVFAVVAIVPLTWLILPGTAHQQTRPSVPSVTGAAAPAPTWTGRDVLRSPMFWIPVLAFIPLNAGFGAVQFNLGAIAQDLGYGPSSAAILISITSLAMIVGKLVFGTLGDRVDHRYLYWGAATLLTCALLAFQYSPTYDRMLAGLIVLGLAAGASLPLMGVIYASRFGTAAFGRVMGLAQSVFMLGAVGPLFAGWVFDTTGSYDPAFMTLVVLVIPVAIGMYWLPGRRDRVTTTSREERAPGT